MVINTSNSDFQGMTDKELMDHCHASKLSLDPLIAVLVKRFDMALQAIEDAKASVQARVQAALEKAVAEELKDSYQYDCDIAEFVKGQLRDLRRVSPDDRSNLLWDIKNRQISAPKTKRRPIPKRFLNVSKPGPKSKTLPTIFEALRKAKSPMNRAELVALVMRESKVSKSAAYKAITEAVSRRLIRDIGDGLYQSS